MHREPHQYYQHKNSQARPDYPAVDVWARGDEGDLPVAEILAAAAAYQDSFRKGQPCAFCIPESRQMEGTFPYFDRYSEGHFGTVGLGW